MTRQSTAKTLTSSAIRKEVGDALSLIRQQDELTWADIGRILGKSTDQAAKYADGSAEIGIVAYTLAEQAWNGRFTGSLRRLIHTVTADEETDRRRCSKVAKALAVLVEAAEDDNISAKEVRQHRIELEDARDAILSLLAKLQPRSATNG